MTVTISTLGTIRRRPAVRIQRLGTTYLSGQTKHKCFMADNGMQDAVNQALQSPLVTCLPTDGHDLHDRVSNFPNEYNARL